MVLHRLLSEAADAHRLWHMQPSVQVRVNHKLSSTSLGTGLARSSFTETTAATTEGGGSATAKTSKKHALEERIERDLEEVAELRALEGAPEKDLSKDVPSVVEATANKSLDAGKSAKEPAEPEESWGQNLPELDKLRDKVFAPIDLTASEAKEIQGEQAKEGLQDKPSIQSAGALRENVLSLQDEKFKDVKELAKETVKMCWLASLRNRRARLEGQMTDAMMHEFLQQMGGCVSNGSALMSRLFQADDQGARAFKYQHGYSTGDIRNSFERAWEKASESCADLNKEARFDVSMQELQPALAATLFLKAGTCVHDIGEAIFFTPTVAASSTPKIAACPPAATMALLARLAPLEEARVSCSRSARCRNTNAAASEFLFTQTVHC
eukprot:TRINITY_DN43861_c0_g1_i1.p1 TRINITY_DN43861_c0_g1~~TRINITY_DN43861_c0_g1_i1.p1  ORF type:complete len:383 (-),score=72.84 TRINITY_DN43861_c0_g1_i1:71-1219(-)